MFETFKRAAKTLVLALSLAAANGCGVETVKPDDSARRLHHLVLIWLKQPGDAALRQRYIDESKALAELPGVLAYHMGTPAAVRRGRASKAVDDSYDVAIAGVFESRQAFEAFLNHPEYLRVAQQVLRPLVESYRVYDFVE
ncbi:Dabb family protein [Methylomonas sp. SURF-2]|uniref:Dabb family protein n=1 Tax=Methylomonas subterranea TaxID=2952225 RepID=A0ABT1TLG4_9GAMM|nr:Dabb family protein [Methylomonas sp. SURF-2]MCQ8106053.1 Dabb family protein [Methylomonas sp. SURF-2]